ncbi:hypothetical protein ACFQFC_05150 [Amorphoplanes digitatis]|uniref:Uncharacterized protein n=1 Tax=Actinoplanes digitatis TaxID=1868 RepID=A0A7W7HZG7_9ACTN|nr:hypothetical protein [Actinoplanes digitatis]MBB4763575.1 hypothetical protein [Actinoplanes digitatis]GID93166.1 hypothetical protein Adi01nite_25780 [Actinoplanes digitatis]
MQALRTVSGTYRGSEASEPERIIEIRVDVDGHRPQHRVSGDVYLRTSPFGAEQLIYVESFVVDRPEVGGDERWMTIGGKVADHADQSLVIYLPRVPAGSTQPAISVNWLYDGSVVATFACPKSSEFFRTATIELDCFQGSTVPVDLDPAIDPSPAGLTGPVSLRSAFADAGIDIRVELDDVLTDQDGPDTGTDWDGAELHDLMEARFDSFANRRQWKLYSVVVPRITSYNPGFLIFGVMFDWGLEQPGDTSFRQGCAMAGESLRTYESGTLYDTPAKKDRLFLQNFVHEVGHAWNLPHTWQRTARPDRASTSFMNYPQNYTGGATGSAAFWSAFRWTFDDVEIGWMRHADLADVIFGGDDFILGNLSRIPTATATPVRIALTAPPIVEATEPVYATLTVTNDTAGPIGLPGDLSPEAGTVRIQLRRPDGVLIEHRPPLRRLIAPGGTATLQPGESRAVSIPLSFTATGPAFPLAGEYRIVAAIEPAPDVLLASNGLRLRVRHPADAEAEELAAVVTRPDVARFLYYGGSARHPGLADELSEVADRHEKTSPATARHLSAALGSHYARRAKYLTFAAGRPVVTARRPDLDAAVRNLERAVAPAPRRVFDDPTLATLAGRLRDARG